MVKWMKILSLLTHQPNFGRIFHQNPDTLNRSELLTQLRNGPYIEIICKLELFNN